MRVLSLNVWYGTRKSELRAFLLSQLENTDVFCFQEANEESAKEIITELSAYNSQLQVARSVKMAGTSGGYYLYTIIKEPITLVRQSSLLGREDSETGQALATELEVDGERLIVVNVHGIPYPGDKLDSEGRLRQTKQILEWLDTQETPAVVCGDFNLEPETKSVQDFAAAGYQNLIKSYAIPTTRNRLVWERYPDNVQLFADYTFISPGLAVTSFKVPNVEVSDHLPMMIDIAVANNEVAGHIEQLNAHLVA